MGIYSIVLGNYVQGYLVEPSCQGPPGVDVWVRDYMMCAYAQSINQIILIRPRCYAKSPTVHTATIGGLGDNFLKSYALRSLLSPKSYLNRYLSIVIMD